MGLDMYIYDEDEHEVAYWRKFNALHKWFVVHVQDGIDECQKSRKLKVEDIEPLIYILKEIDKNPIVAQGLMPTSDGFFFGSTNYDNYFLEDVRSSIPIFEDLLEKIKYGESLHYQSSW